ncbi:hypothetical protein Ocin01_15138 [Orchesella cincta]|uniref:Uncharacterized protein n=1 Tax=Orchesella cincta TaxID=48709 RepID=A0A1D2MEX5_ORCCI|nr:hypothetical protein Ocin01_15138 [Orchesella cincta]
MSLNVKILFGVVFELYLISQFGKVHTIGCFICFSRNGSNPNCEDPFHPGFSTNSTYTEKCKVPKRNHIGEFPAHFCIKVIGTSYNTNDKVVIRRCTTATMDNQCGNFQFEEDLLHGCILTCDLDGCNSSKSLRYSFLSILIPLSLSITILKTTIPWHSVT